MDSAPRRRSARPFAALRPADVPVALVTGATSGIGLEFARALAADGYHLVLVARTLPRLEETADLLEDEFGVPVRVLSADLASEQGIATVVAFIGHERVDVVVNNAGYGLPYSALRSDPAELAALDRVLNVAVQQISWHAAQRMLERGRGGIITVSSMAALTTMGAYAAAKSAAMVFTENLAGELAGTPVTATAVLPGYVHTEFHDRMRVDMSKLPSVAWVDARTVAREGLADARAGKAVSVPGLQYKIAYLIAQTAPRPLIRGVSSGFRAVRMTRRSRRRPS
ncbi:SDR family NAD(P)-dependent oxidoreductase [Brevibacterium ihuae]|uniref:SDR family NAD(P)-dependent oxidoreductase n=1 Tax=Brevibacterium ihuae TaxID=1631743 RepID=UPI000C78FAF6|nr:SDR family NAD(P)-dependent oxidoreductase [Brevibacterium ihuae]